MNDVYSAGSAAIYIGISTRTLIRLIKAGDVAAKKNGHAWEIHAAEVKRLAEHYAKSTGKQPSVIQAPAPPRRANEYTAPIVSAPADELQANRARLDAIARRAKSARVIGADGSVQTTMERQR